MEELEEAMWGAVGWLEEVSSAEWDSLGRLCNMSGRELKSCCVAAGHTQGAFIYDKVFKHAHEYPWRLCRRGGGAMHMMDGQLVKKQ